MSAAFQFTKHRRAALECLTNFAKLHKPGTLERVTIDHNANALRGGAQSFLLPDNGELLASDTPTQLQTKSLHLPFPKIVLEFNWSKDWFREGTGVPIDASIIYAEEPDDGDGIAFLCMFKLGPAWLPALRMYRFLVDSAITISKDGSVRATNVKTYISHADAEKRFPDMPDDVTDEIRVLTHFLFLANCTNVKATKIYEPPPRLAKRNSERGNPPMFDYWMLDCHLGERIEHATSDGGEHHASPRFHVRRGHVRRLPNEAGHVWVRQCAVGNPSIGVVEKDYRLRTT